MTFKNTGEKEIVVKEGLASLVIPNPELYRRPDGKVEPAWMPVFYNPVAAVNRDVTVLFLNCAMRGKHFLFVDALSGTGVRGIRICLEVGGHGLLNDVSARAYHYIVKNIKLNKLEARIDAYNCEANALMNNLAVSGVYVDYVDIDPYGSPSPFVDSALKPLSREAYLGITATDVASLSCTYPHKTLSRYWSKCFKVDFDKEFATRVLISNVVLKGSALEISLEPVIAFVHAHYIRVFFKAVRSASKAHITVKNCIGYLWYCKKTLERGFIRFTEEVNGLSCLDGSKPILLGPLWICNIEDPRTIEMVLKLACETQWINRDTLKILFRLSEESSIEHPYYRLDKLCSSLGVNMPKLEELIEKLRSYGIKCSRTHMDPRGIRIEGSYTELTSAIKSLTK